MRKTVELVRRDRYLERALMFRDTDLIKVVTGVRRCGKSRLLDLVKAEIEADRPDGSAFAQLNLESKECPVTTEDGLYSFFRKRLAPSGRTYIFIDEPQRVQGWQNAVNAMRVDFDCDIYLTGSNAFLLSSQLSTYLSGRYVEIKMLPLAFDEYCDFCGVSFGPGSSVAVSPDGTPVLFDDLFTRYLVYGGMPAIASLMTDQAIHSAYIAGLVDAVIVRDVLNQERPFGRSQVKESAMLDKVVRFLGDNVGNEMSANSIANTLTSVGAKTTNKTVGSYVSALNEAYLFYETSRYDLHGKAILRTNPKQYIVDLGIKSYLEGYRRSDMGRAFENAVYLQLLFEGWSVHVGKLYSKEVDFVAIKDGRVLYVQATDEMFSDATRERAFSPLRSIRDAHEKIVVVRQGSYEADADGIKILSARDFFISPREKI